MTATSFRSSVEDWLQRNGLKKYEPLFRENEIDLDLLPELDGQDLKELGIPLGDRKRLLRAIAKLKSSDLHVLPRAGEESRETAQIGRAERRQITIMFCDLVSATKLSNEL